MPNLIGGIVLGYIWQLIINGVLYRFNYSITSNPAGTSIPNNPNPVFNTIPTAYVKYALVSFTFLSSKGKNASKFTEFFSNFVSKNSKNILI